MPGCNWEPLPCRGRLPGPLRWLKLRDCVTRCDHSVTFAYPAGG